MCVYPVSKHTAGFTTLLKAQPITAHRRKEKMSKQNDVRVHLKRINPDLTQ